MKNGHLVFDDGNNQNRIFYFEEDSNICIYKVFTDHSKYESYLNSSSQLDKDKIKKESKSRRVEKLEKEVNLFFLGEIEKTIIFIKLRTSFLKA